ncbi:plasma membrane H(+)-ATPase 1 [Crepidotus variabilis]|uniref:Plasma membrane ATPase n=1 Tax=Crepidotus variabilis TaxID=179855 RepID=A0A9P6EJX9_9AGAR|nr:plasma membrane H(+)-ATPase 1 [Crepidotus variabilis]
MSANLPSTPVVGGDSGPPETHRQQSEFNPESNGETANEGTTNEKTKEANANQATKEQVGSHKDAAAVDLSQVELKAENLYDKEKVDIEAIPLEEVFELLQCTSDGLDQKEVNDRLQIFGPNKLESHEQNAFLQFLTFMWNPLSWVMEAAALVAIVLANGQGAPPDWEDFIGIIILLLANSAIGFYEERNAGNAVKALMDSLAPKAKVKRNGEWIEIESANLVPGDMISFKIGDIVPADCRLTEAINVSIDQAALTGESLPQSKETGSECFSGSTCKQGEAEGVAIATGRNTFFGRAASLVGEDDDSTGHLQKILAQIGSFCLVTIGIFVLAEIFVLYAGFRYQYRRGLNNILVLLIGGIPIAMPTVLSVTLAVGATQLAKYKAIVTRITAIEEMAGVTILCSDKTGTLTTNKLTIDRNTVKTFSHFSVEQVILLSAYASRTENQDAIDSAVVTALGDPSKAREGINLLDFKPFNPVDKRTEITYREESSGKVKRVTKGMTGVIIDLCTRNKTEDQEAALEQDVQELAQRGLRTIAVAYEELPGDDHTAEGDGFELVGVLAIFDPPREDTKQTIDDALALGVRVKMITGDQLAIAKETGRRLGLGDHMWPAKVLKDGPPANSEYNDLDGLILGADGFAGVFPEHKYEIVRRLQGLGHLVAMTGDGANDAPALSRANVGIAVEGATDAARGAADIVLTEPGLSTIVHAISQSRIIFQRMRNYAIYACAVTIRIVVCFAVLAFTYKFDFPPFMILIIALLNDGTIMTLSVDRVKPSLEPDTWDLAEIFAYAIAYGLYLTASTVALIVIIIETNFFQSTFGVTLQNSSATNVNDPQLHMIAYLQVAIISQALIFVTRAHGFFFMERPSFALMIAFCIAQLVSSIIAAYGNWGFTNIHSISGAWIGIIWVWNIIWFIPLDWVKFAMKATIIKSLRNRRIASVKQAAAAKEAIEMGVEQPQHTPLAQQLSRTTSRAASVHESFYRNRTNFLAKTMHKVGFRSKRVAFSPAEQRKFSAHGTRLSGQTLQKYPSGGGVTAGTQTRTTTNAT